MRIEMVVDQREIKGHEAVRFEIFDGNQNRGTFTVGKGGVRWYAPKAHKNYKAKSWNELITWLEQHGRTRSSD